MAHVGMPCPKCITVLMKPRPSASGAGMEAFQCPACGKMAVLDVQSDAPASRSNWVDARAPTEPIASKSNPLN
jgi:hypothetical protein